MKAKIFPNNTIKLPFKPEIDSILHIENVGEAKVLHLFKVDDTNFVTFKIKSRNDYGSFSYEYVIEKGMLS